MAVIDRRDGLPLSKWRGHRVDFFSELMGVLGFQREKVSQQRKLIGFRRIKYANNHKWVWRNIMIQESGAKK